MPSPPSAAGVLLHSHGSPREELQRLAGGSSVRETAQAVALSEARQSSVISSVVGVFLVSQPPAGPTQTACARASVLSASIAQGRWK